MIRLPLLNVLSPRLGHLVVGRHAIWWPAWAVGRTTGLKFPFQFGGRVQKYQKPHEPTYPRETIGEEVAALLWLAEHHMASRPLGWAFAEVCISAHLEAWWADPLGLLGYEMERAEALPPGRFSVDVMRASGMFSGSEGAWSDLAKPGNVINGYLVDLRRSWWDRIRFLGEPLPLPDLTEDREALQEDLRQYGQFPFGERDLVYQECFLDGRWCPGERDVRQRAATMGYAPIPGDSVVDIGCHVGGFLYASVMGLNRGIGVDVRSEYIDLARRLARANGMNHCFRAMDVEAEIVEFVHWITALYPAGIDHLLLLSLSKHFLRGDATVFQLIDALRPRWAYAESNAVNAQNPFPMLADVQVRGGAYVGDSTDRNLRRLYRIPYSGTGP